MVDKRFKPKRSSVMEELQDIFNGEEMNNRKPRMIEPLDEGYVSPVSITDGTLRLYFMLEI